MLHRLVYSALFYVLMPFVMVRVLWRSIKEPAYRQAPWQRLGAGPRLSSPDLIWVHAVSAGETIAAVPLVEALLAAGHDVLVTNMTPTGREQTRQRLGNRVHNCYAPYDLPGSVKRFLQRTRPKRLVIIDTEIWPNMIHYSARAGLQVFLVNARLSARSARGYGRLATLTRSTLQKVTAVGVQSPAQGERFVALGVEPARLYQTGSIKFDAVAPADMDSRSETFAALLGERLILVAASTHEDEERQLLDAVAPLCQQYPALLLVLAPRHPHRAERVHELCRQRHLQTRRRSENTACDTSVQVFLLDTMGELEYVYDRADLVFVGGSLVPVGGHNPMEPARSGKPVIMGPYLRNIADIAELFEAQGGLLRVASEADLAAALARLCADAQLRQRMGQAAQRVVAANTGALQATLAMMDASTRTSTRTQTST